MSVQTLAPAVLSRSHPYRQQSAAPLPAKLQDVEDRLLSEAMERHPGGERAITHLLNDLERPAALEGPAGRLGTPIEAAQRQRMEDLLLQTIMNAHPHASSALDRLLGDVVGDAAIDD